MNPLRIRIEHGRWWLERLSLLITPRHLAVGGAVIGACLVVGVAGLRTGAIQLDFQEILRTLTGGGTRTSRLVILQWRLPRLILAIAAGAALGTAGQLFQVVTGNPLGSPDLIGFSMGAQTGVLLSVLVLPANVISVSLAALLGGVFVGAIIFVLSLRGGFSGLRLILAGIAISSMLASGNRWLLLRVDADSAFGAMRAVTGTLAAANWAVVVPVTGGIAAVLALIVPLTRQMRMLPLGVDLAESLGTEVVRVRMTLVLLGTALVALVTMAAGPIGFVALVSPHLARALAGTDVPLPFVSGAVGALLLVLSDVVSQAVLESMPVGVVTSAVGGIYLMAVLILMARRSPS